MGQTCCGNSGEERKRDELIDGREAVQLNQQETEKLVKIQAWVRGNNVRKDQAEVKQQ